MTLFNYTTYDTSTMYYTRDDDISDDIITLSNIRLPNMTDVKVLGIISSGIFLFTIINACFLHFSFRILIGVSAGLTFLKTIVFLICMREKIKYYLKKLLSCFFFCFCFSRFCFVTSCFRCCLRSCKSTFHNSNETIFSQDRNKDESNSSQKI